MILVVEDHQQIGNAVRLLLQSAGHEVSLARSGEEALDHLREHRPHLIVLDVSLPGISGLDVLRRLRGTDELREVPVIVNTASPEPEIEAEAKRLGAAFVRKHTPEFFDLPALVAENLAHA